MMMKMKSESQLGMIMEDVEHKFDLIMEGHEAVKADLRRNFKEEIGKVRIDIDVKFAQVDVRFEQIDRKFEQLEENF